MPKVRTTLIIDEEVLRTIKVKAARTGKRHSEVIEEALRRDLGLEFLERLWAAVDPMSEEQAMSLALEAQHATRKRRR